MAKNHLLLIDPQNDFCDLPQNLLPPDPNHPQATLVPSLPVPGAHADMLRIAAWLEQNLAKVDDITVTMDHHHRLDIAHPPFWRRADGTPVTAFTPITALDVREGRITPAPGIDRAAVLDYLEKLEAKDRFTHMVWPIHCQIGTWGQCIHGILQQALDGWEDAQTLRVTKVLKGENPFTEHYSALCAEIPLAEDPKTGLNRDLLDRLAQAEQVLIAGEAGSHCVRATVEHLVEHWPHPLDRLVLVTNAMSPVPGFEDAQACFLKAMEERGVRLRALDELLLA